MKQLRYYREFKSRAGVAWKVEIWQEAEAEYSQVGILELPADEPLLIEWSRTDKEEVICGSTATLKVISPGDRTYEDLYAIEAGSIRLDVYREGALYWSGTLDPEFYEEPYERKQDYEVTLTFSDFGILDRLKYSLTGMQTLKAILLEALDRCALNYEALDTSFCSTYFSDTADKADPAALSIRSENFIDEDGEASTLEEVVRGILQPLALRMVQRAGKVYIYDLNGLYNTAERRAVTWSGSSQTMGTDKVVNNVRVSFSPYSESKLLDDSLVYTDRTDESLVNLTTDKDACEDGLEYYSLYPNASEVWQGKNVDYSDVNFTLFLSNKGRGVSYLSPSARYCHILPMLSGPSEQTCIAWTVCLGTNMYTHKLATVGEGPGAVVLMSNRVFLPRLSEADRKKYYLKLSLEMLLDARYNPFTEATDDNENYGEEYENFKVWTGWAFVPVAVTLYDAQGKAISHFTNKNKTTSATQGNMAWSALESTTAEGQEPAIGWKPGADPRGDCWLAYYNTEDQKEDTGILGWKKNRQNIGRPDVDSRKGGYTDGKTDYTKGYFPPGDFGKFYMYESFKKQPEGEYIPYPEEGGYIEVMVYSGARCFDYGEDSGFNTTKYWTNKKLYQKIRWMLYKAPVLEVVRKNLVFDEAELQDVEYSGYLNKAAKEDISLDTICGTANLVCPTARGIYHRVSDNLQIRQLQRAGVTDHPERLLIGTLYSQYATRHVTLQGEAEITPGGLCAYTEQCQEGKLFLLSEDLQDIVADTTEALYTELSPDHYEAIEEANS